METERVTLEEALTVYQLEFLSARNYAANTRHAYVRDIRDLIDFLTGSTQLAHPDAVGKLHLEAFLSDLDQRGLSGNSRRRIVASVRSFFAFCADRGFTQADPTTKLVSPAREYTEARYLILQRYFARITPSDRQT